MAGIDAYTKLMLHMDGANGSTVFTDSSLTPKTVTVNGNAQIATAESKFGSGGGLFDGSGDFLNIAHSADFDLALVDFTLDLYVRPATNPAPSGYGGLVTGDSSLLATGWELWIDSSRVVHFSKGGAGTEILTSPALTANAKAHVAVVRNGTGAAGLTLYVNGVAVDTYTGNISLNSDGYGLAVGRIYVTNFNGHYFSGGMDELRLSKGIARWAADFTPPTEAYSEEGGGGAGVENLKKWSGGPVIATDTAKEANARLKAQGWEVTNDTATQPQSGAGI